MPGRTTACLILALIGWATGGVARADESVPLTVAEVAPGVMVHNGKQALWSAANHGDVANLGFIIGRDCVAIIDTGGSPSIGTSLLAAIRKLTPVPVCYVINTHVHPDHILGNAAFATLQPRPRFVAHARLSGSLAARQSHYRDAAQRELGLELSEQEVVHPDMEVETAARLDLGGRSLELRAWPTAHTDNDLTVQDTQTGTLFLGDLLFAGHLPVLDGRLLGWLQVMDELAAIDANLVVPGHGPITTAWPAALQLQRDYLTAVRDRTRAAIAAGETIGQAVDAAAQVATDGWLLSDEFHRRNLTAAYAELEWED